MTFSNHDYYSRTINLIKSQPNIKDVVLYGVLISLIPIIGFMWVSGFILKWAIDVSCGRSIVLTKDDFDFKSCIHKGFIFVCVGLIYRIGFNAALSILSPLKNLLLTSSIYSLLKLVGRVLVPIFGVLAGFYAVVLDDFSAGFKVDKFYEMIKRDLNGFLSVAFIALVVVSVLGLISSALIGLVTAVSGVDLAMGVALSLLQSSLITSLLNLLIVAPLLILLTSAITSISYFLGSLFVGVSYALWISQYQVTKWKNKDEELPDQLSEGDII